jgi:hypothetical protein
MMTTTRCWAMEKLPKSATLDLQLGRRRRYCISCFDVHFLPPLRAGTTANEIEENMQM